MYGLEQGDIIARGEGYTLYRRGTCMGMHAPGKITDSVSVSWKRAMGESFTRNGYPRFVWLDMKGCEPDNTMGERFRTASFIRESLRQIEWCAIHTGKTTGVVIVLRTMLRIIGLSHFVLYDDEAEWRAAVDAMKAGRRPGAPAAGAGSTQAR